MKFDLLRHRGSLTQKLRELSRGKMQFHLLSANWSHANPDEAKILGIPESEAVWIRHIEMRNGETLWTVGRVLIPKNSLNGHDCDLTQLGELSIGDVIFKDPNLERSEFEIFEIDALHPYHQHLPADFPNTNDSIWARRSVVGFRQHLVLIVELFMPDVLNHAC